MASPSGIYKGSAGKNQRSSSFMAFCSPNHQSVIVVPGDNFGKCGAFRNPIVIDDEVEFLGEVEKNSGSCRKNPIIVEQERPRRARFSGPLRSKRPFMEAPWEGKLVIEIGETSGTKSEEKSKFELKDSSGSTWPEPDCTCEICADWKCLYELFSVEGCSHTYCTSCISQYVAAKVEENVLFIKCPDPDCKKGKLEPVECKLILAQDLFDRWCLALCELTVSDKIYCPFKDCSALLINEEKVITQTECPHCCRLFCAQCLVPWHEGFKCEDYQKLGKHERAQEDLMLFNLAKERKWQRCPKCKILVEKTDGCMFMKCRCSFTFCYNCGSEMIVDHFCRKCQR